MKTDRRDALSLVKLYRAGELIVVWVPDAAHEAMLVVSLGPNPLAWSTVSSTRWQGLGSVFMLNTCHTPTAMAKLTWNYGG